MLWRNKNQPQTLWKYLNQSILETCVYPMEHWNTKTKYNSSFEIGVGWETYANLDDWNSSSTIIWPSSIRFNETLMMEKIMSDPMNPNTIYFIKNMVNTSVPWLACIKHLWMVPDWSRVWNALEYFQIEWN